MNGKYAPGRITLEADPSSTSQPRLAGLTLVLARGFWLAGFVTMLIIFVVSIPAYVAYLHTISRSGVDVYAGQLNADGLRSLHTLGLSLDGYAASLVGVKVLFVSVWLAVGAVIFWCKSDDRLALFASFTLVTYSIGFGFWIEAVLPTWWVPLLCLNFLSGVCIGLFLYIFPDGRFAPRWTRWPLIIGPVYNACNSTFLAGPLNASPLLSTLNGFLFFGLLVSGVAVQVYRYRRVSTAVQRQQTKWAVFGFAMALTGSIVALSLGTLLSTSYLPGTLFYLGLSTLLYVSLLFIPLSIGLAILRSHLWDIDLIINRTLVYGALTASIISMYILVVGYLGALFRTSNNLLISLVATGLVAILFQPLRELLQRGVNRLFYGHRDEPSRVVSRLGQRLEATLAPEAVLPTIVETVAQALKLPYASILLKHDDAFTVAASFGNPRGEPLTLPLVYQRESIGKLLLAPRTGGEDFTSADLRLLNELTRQVSLAAHAVRLTTNLQRLAAELQSSRIQLVTAREEERRRLRRDLHDGLGSALTGLTFQLDAASNVLDRDPQAVKLLLKELKAQTQASIADIRRLVYNLRPPILDEWGLVAAVREQVAQYQLDSVQVTIDAPESLPALPAAIEVAAYRIALEGLANVIRHAQASTCTIRLSICDDALTVEAQDDGHGLPSSYRAGVGINAMRERAAELGGSCTVETLATGGTRVSARLPLVKE